MQEFNILKPFSSIDNRGRGLIITDKVIDGVKAPKPCEYKRAVELKKPARGGAYIPQCDSEGYYKPKQCTASACWCADKMGNQISEKQSRFGTPLRCIGGLFLSCFAKKNLS